jgi:hypothetical protein
LAVGDDDFVVALVELEAALGRDVEFDFLPGAGVVEEREPVVARVAAGTAGAVAGASAGIGSMVMLADSVCEGDVAETVRTSDAGADERVEDSVAMYVGGAAGAALGETFATETTAGAGAETLVGGGTCATEATLEAGLALAATGAAIAEVGFTGIAAGAGATFAA